MNACTNSETLSTGEADARISRLTEPQRAILTAASERPDGNVLPVPPEVRVKGAALVRILEALARRGLIQQATAEIPGDDGDIDGGPGHANAFRISAAGLRAIEGPDSMLQLPDAGEQGPAGQTEHNGPAENDAAALDLVAASQKSPASRPGRKSDILVALLKRPEGASLGELMEITAWQAHSVRGFLSGTVKKRLGLDVESLKDDAGVRRYRIGS